MTFLPPVPQTNPSSAPQPQDATSPQTGASVLISACLVGCTCRYDGKHQARQEMVALYQKGEAIAVCPEELAELGTPREPCEKQGHRIVSVQGEDKTHLYQVGAKKALDLAQEISMGGIKLAYLKTKSPMCGYGEIYDGSFSGTLKEGKGVFAEYLERQGIDIRPVD